MVIRDGPMPGVCELCMRVRDIRYIETFNCRVCLECVVSLMETLTGRVVCRTCYRDFRNPSELQEHVYKSGHTPETHFRQVKHHDRKTQEIPPAQGPEGNIFEDPKAEEVFEQFMAQVQAQKGEVL